MSLNRQQTRLFGQLIARLAPEMQAAFLASAEDMRAGLDWVALVAALEAGDIEGAVAALNIEPASFYRYSVTKQAAYTQGGVLAAQTINAPGTGAIGFRFDMMNPRAERWVAENVGQRIVAVTEDTKQAAREVIGTGYQAGRHPHTIARDIAGKAAPGGTRQGGIIGLDGPRASRLDAVTRGMETAEGVQDLVIKGQDGKLQVRYRVNRATEQRIIRAYSRGEAVPAADRAISVRQYQNALLKDRADTIAHTETQQAVMAARDEEWRQAAEKLGLDDSAIIKTWRHGGGVRDPRPHHVAMNGQSVRGLDTPFEFSNGARLRFAGDPRGGAAEVIKCTCDTIFRLDHTRGLT
ncbi:MAG: hypothetical protein FJX25_05825 [Alphaproteobacteria bacterium]|nr:hypothetical protein [Alphaproteobacteria bacterium]